LIKQKKTTPLGIVTPVQPLALGVKDAALACGLSKSAIYAAIKSGALKSFRIGGRRLIYLADLQAFLEESKKTSSNPNSDSNTGTQGKSETESNRGNP